MTTATITTPAPTPRGGSEEELDVDTLLGDMIVTAFDKYHEHGPRSSKKLDVIHGGVAEILDILTSNHDDVYSKGYKHCKEYTLRKKEWGYKKDCDITLLRDGEPYLVITVKFPMSNTRQNAGNYSENLTGEVVHIRRAYPNVKISHLLFLPMRVPYYTSSGFIKKFDHVNNDDILKYRTMVEPGSLDNMTIIPIDVTVDEASMIGKTRGDYHHAIRNTVHVMSSEEVLASELLEDEEKKYILSRSMRNLISFAEQTNR